jgi:hypothetical protein
LARAEINSGAGAVNPTKAQTENRRLTALFLLRGGESKRTQKKLRLTTEDTEKAQRTQRKHKIHRRDAEENKERAARWVMRRQGSAPGTIYRAPTKSQGPTFVDAIPSDHCTVKRTGSIKMALPDWIEML